jgi:hypothetical protein
MTADGVYEVLGRRVLEQKSACPGADGGEEVAIFAEGGQDQNAAAGDGGEDPACGLQGVGPGHADVHDYDVWSQAPGRATRGCSLKSGGAVVGAGR